jgi:hypothetical protein
MQPLHQRLPGAQCLAGAGNRQALVAVVSDQRLRLDPDQPEEGEPSAIQAEHVSEI